MFIIHHNRLGNTTILHPEEDEKLGGMEQPKLIHLAFDTLYVRAVGGAIIKYLFERFSNNPKGHPHDRRTTIPFVTHAGNFKELPQQLVWFGDDAKFIVANLIDTPTWIDKPIDLEEEIYNA